jgi:hypothetical protein
LTQEQPALPSRRLFFFCVRRRHRVTSNFMRRSIDFANASRDSHAESHLLICIARTVTQRPASGAQALFVFARIPETSF